MIVAALILVLAIGINYSVGSIKIGIVSLSGLAVASIVGIAVNAILPGKDYVFQQEDKGATSVDFSAGYTSIVKAMGKTIAFFLKISIDNRQKTSIIFLALSGFV